MNRDLYKDIQMFLRYLLNGQFAYFIFVGLTSAALDIGLMQLLIYIGMKPMYAGSFGFFSGVIVNYRLHAGYTFKVNLNLLNFIRFMMVVGVNYFITMLFLYAFFYMFQSTALVGKIISLPFVAINGFLLSKYWVFK